MLKQLSDEQLMQHYGRGKVHAFELLYARHKDPLYRYFARQCRHSMAAEELCQEVWLGIIKARQRYQVTAKFTTYLYTMAHNRLVDYYRKHHKDIPVSYQTDAEDPTQLIPTQCTDHPDYQCDQTQQQQRLQDLIMALPEAQREVFLLKEETGLALEHIAHMLGINQETTKSRLRYAMKKLRAGLRSHNEE